MAFSPKQLIGSQTAKGGFQNEHDIVDKFNGFQTDYEAKIWLDIMGYDVHLTANFNQIDKRSVDTYQTMWGFDDDIAITLKKFTGVIQPNVQEQKTLRDKRRWYLNELPTKDVDKLLDFFTKNKVLIFGDILKGRGMLSAEWFLVTKSNGDNTTDWVLKNINEVINFYAQGEIAISKQGGLILGRLTAQRKGGTPDPTSLQFKIKPLDLFGIST